jgi:protein ImuA
MFLSNDPAAWRSTRAIKNLARQKTPAQQTFNEVRAAVASAPLNEIMPAAPGDHAAALGFSLAWALMASQDGVIFWAAPERDFFEDGLPNAEGLAQFGLSLDRLLLVRTNSQIDALWATEQALATPGILALCAISPGKKIMSLTATRRLLLAAEKHKTRCILLRLDSAGTSAAWSRWRVSTVPGQGMARELDAPSFTAHLIRNRAGPSGLSVNLQWDIHEHAFRITKGGPDTAMDGTVSAASADRPTDAQRHNAA